MLVIRRNLLNVLVLIAVVVKDSAVAKERMLAPDKILVKARVGYTYKLTTAKRRVAKSLNKPQIFVDPADSLEKINRAICWFSTC
jgi:hypothetical protein